MENESKANENKSSQYISHEIGYSTRTYPDRCAPLIALQSPRWAAAPPPPEHGQLSAVLHWTGTPEPPWMVVRRLEVVTWFSCGYVVVMWLRGCHVVTGGPCFRLSVVVLMQQWIIGESRNSGN